MSWYFAQGGNRMGPVSREELQRRVQAGEILPADLVWTQGMEQWQAAGSVPGLFPEGYVAPAPPPLPMPHAQPGFPQPPPRPMGDDAMMRVLLPVGRSGWAIAAGYLGLLSFLGVFGPFALLTGILAVIDIRRNPQKHGMGRAVFGIVMGVLGSAALIFILFAAAQS
jgi:GYF domain 2/Domain of unknown function (DUF4190)